MKKSEKKKILNMIIQFLEKQVMCEKLIDSGLSFIKGTSKIRRKVLLGSQGIITKYPEWRFYFHGGGVRLTNEKTDEMIDYDYLEHPLKHLSHSFKIKRLIGGFNAGWLCTFIKNQIEIKRLNKKEYSKFAEYEIWQKILDELEKEGIIKKTGKYNALYFLNLTKKDYLKLVKEKEGGEK